MQVQVNQQRTLWVITAVVMTFASAYFLLSFNRDLIPFDEGYLLYSFYKFARGEIPHRDFYDIYGALTYVVGGTLFKLFGTRILVIRIFVLLMKTFMAVLVFWIGRCLMPSLFAFLGAILFILCWGDPGRYVFNVLYAGHCAHLLALTGIGAMLLYFENRGKPYLAAAGLLGGLVLHFKLTTGVFLLIAFGLTLCFKEQLFVLADQPDAETPRAASSRISVLRLTKVLIIIGTGIIFLFFLSRFHPNPYYFITFLSPLLLFLCFMLARELSPSLRQVRAEQEWASFRGFVGEILVLALGPVLVLALQVLMYYRIGGLNSMLYDTFELPFRINYAVPLENARGTVLWILAVVILVFLAMLAGTHYRNMKQSAKRFYFLATIGVLASPAAYLLIHHVPFQRWDTWVIQVLPTSILLISFLILLKPAGGKREGINVQLRLSLGYLSGSTFLMLAFPRSDKTNFVVNSTVIFILAAFLIWRLSEASKYVFDKKTRLRGAVWCTAVFLLMSSTFVWSLEKFYIARLPRFIVYFAHGGIHLHLNGKVEPFHFCELQAPRAEGLKIHESKQTLDLNGVIQFIREHTAPSERILVLGDEQILYFLSERDTIFPKENNLVHMSTVGLINSETTTKLTDVQMLERLTSTRPRYIVQKENSRLTQAFRATWPLTASFIKEAYLPASEFGQYQILQFRELNLRSGAVSG